MPHGKLKPEQPLGWNCSSEGEKRGGEGGGGKEKGERRGGAGRGGRRGEVRYFSEWFSLRPAWKLVNKVASISITFLFMKKVGEDHALSGHRKSIHERKYSYISLY